MPPRFGLLAAAVLCVVGTLGACTLVSDFDIHQCETSADCDTLSGTIRRCEDARCVDGCEDNHQCAVFDPRTPICPARGDACASLTSEDGSCFVSSAYDDASMGKLEGRDLAIVGAFSSSLQSSTWLTLQLAVDELNQSQAAFAGTVLPPALVVLCDGSAASISLSMDHLVRRLRAHTLIGSFEDVALRIAADQPDLRDQALLLRPQELGVSTESWRADLAWHLGGRSADVVPAYPALIQGARDLVEQRAQLPETLRVATLESEASEDVALAAQVAAGIELNGKDASYLFREDRFRRFVLADDLPEARARTLDALAAYAPDLMLVFAGGTFAVPPQEGRLAVVQELEERAEGSEWTPLYLFSPRAVDDSALVQLAASSSSFRARALGLSADRALDPLLAAALVTRFRAAFPEAMPPRGGFGPSFLTYDAFYYLAYARAAAPRPATTPEALLDGLSRVVDFDQPCVDVGPEGISDAVAHIAAQEPFQICGSTGPVRFGTDRGRAAAARLFCWAPVEGELPTDTLLSIDSPFSTPAPRSEPPCAQQFFRALESAP